MKVISKSSYSSDIKVPFTFESAAAVNLGSLVQGKRITEVSVIIDQVFNGTTPKASVGISADHELLSEESDSMLTAQGEYCVKPNYVVTAASIMLQLYLTLSGATTGSGTILVRVI